MRYLTWLLRIALFGALLGFAIKNNEIVSLRYLFGYEWRLPLVVALLVFLVIGVAIGMLAMLGTVVRLRRELARMRAALGSGQSTAGVIRTTPSEKQSP
jgi:uncharacterized integral membrane protein